MRITLPCDPQRTDTRTIQFEVVLHNGRTSGKRAGYVEGQPGLMYEKKTLPDLNCGLDLIGEVLYGKWKMRLLWFINEGFQRPSEL